MVKLHPQALDFKVRVNIQTYQSWVYKNGDSVYTLYMTWEDQRNAWHIDFEKTSNGITTTPIRNIIVKDNEHLAKVLLMTDYPPVHERSGMYV